MKVYNKEFYFIIKLVGIIVVASLLSYGLLYLLTDQGLGSDYGAAFRIISDVHMRMNYYIVTAVLIQFIISSLLVFFLALHYSHKIAGPMYRLKLLVRRFLQGEDVEKVSFRNTDLLHEFAEKFSDFFVFMAQREKQFVELKNLMKKIDLHDDKLQQAALQNIRNKLKALKQ